MKVTAFNDLYSTQISTGSTTLYSTSGGSNSGVAGGDVVGEAGDLSVVRLASSVSLGSNMTGSVGDVLTLVQTTPTKVAQFATPSNTGGAAFGSNSTFVSETTAVGVSSNTSRADHTHGGIALVTASSSNTMQRGTFNLRAGTSVSFGLTDGDGDGELDTLTINNTGASTAGSVNIPTVIQAASNGTGATSVTIAAAASGHRLVMFTNSTTGQVTSPSCTNVTWSQLLTFTSAASSYYAIWVGVVAGGSSGTSITMTKPGTYNTVTVLEVTDALTPTAGTTSGQDHPAKTGTGVNRHSYYVMPNAQAGRFVVLAFGVDNTASYITLLTNFPSSGVRWGVANTIVVGYVAGDTVSMSGNGGPGAVLFCEVT